ncbi:MAG TPA: hypothetical protein VEB42_02880, partial [Chitinophagaceae bacterium]|nr:hypothetical protein [Chitinophagaceae bacterium]
PGHYFRRIKSVAVSIPCIVGPYASVNCTLTLTKSTIRKKPLLSDGEYAKSGDGDERFDTYLGSMQSIVTSSAMNDSGLFETNLKDDRKLPFEYSGAVSEWQLSLPGREGEVRQFNYDTISDVIMHVRYTAREGGELLRKAAMKNISDQVEAIAAAGTTRLFSVRHEFPNEWEKFKSFNLPAGSSFAPLSLPFSAQHYPYWSKGLLQVVHEVTVIVQGGKNSITLRPDPNDNTKEDVLNVNKALGGLKSGKLANIGLPDPVGVFNLAVDDKTISEMWVAVKWGK